MSNYYGLNQKWDLGIAGLSASYFNAPESASGSELAQEAFGEGSLIASPLAMASVAATVDEGMFKQPILVTGLKQVTATALPAEHRRPAQADDAGRGDQRDGGRHGVWPRRLRNTGTADIQGQEQPNSWLIAFDPGQDIAVAALVLNAGYGAQFAGPEVKQFLSQF